MKGIRKGVKDVKEKEKELQNNYLGENPFIQGASKVCVIDVLKTSLEDEKLSTINFVSISLPKLHDSYVEGNNKSEPLIHTIYRYKENFRNEILTEYKEALLHAVKTLKGNIISFNELGMPLNEKGVADTKALNYTQNLATKYNCLIIAGTNHTKNGFLNVGYIFYPLVEKGDKYKTFFKNISAFKAYELIFTPSERKILYTEAFGLGLTFLICLDVVDFSNASRITANYIDIDFLIVPTYLSTYGPIEKVSSKISEAIGGVLLTNRFTSISSPHSRMYLFGKNMDESSQPKITYTKSKKTLITLRKINIENFKKEKKKSKLSDNLEYLFNKKKKFR